MSAKKATSSKKRKKLALGRGLDALIPTAQPAQPEHQEPGANELFECDVDLIEPNRYQPRSHFDPDELAQLSDSIRSQGVLQPILVRKLDFGYELVAGERRLRTTRRSRTSCRLRPATAR